MVHVHSCHISKAISFKTYVNTSKVPRELLHMKRVPHVGNALLDAIINDLPYAKYGMSYCIGNTWYKFKLLSFKDNTARFAQFVVSSPMSGETFTKSIRYVDVEFGL